MTSEYPVSPGRPIPTEYDSDGDMADCFPCHEWFTDSVWSLFRDEEKPDEIKIQAVIDFFGEKFRVRLIELLTGETNTELFSNN